MILIILIILIMLQILVIPTILMMLITGVRSGDLLASAGPPAEGAPAADASASSRGMIYNIISYCVVSSYVVLY